VTEGQQLALRQLRSVQAARSGALEILSIYEPNEPHGELGVEISLDCAGVDHRPEGIRMRGRERLLLFVPPRFPLTKPSVYTPHKRWRGTPHVQWGYSVCLYASSATEWHPADGMFGLLDRLWEWLQAAAIGQLDPDGVPLHPPVAYHTSGTPLVIPRADTPTVGDEPWLGWATAELIRERRFDLTAWTPMRLNGSLQDTPQHAAPTILLPSRLDWEYPDRALGLIIALIDRGVDWGDFWSLLEFTALERPGEPLLLVIGTAMRGLAGGEPRQHLTAWRIPAEATSDLWRSLGRHSQRPELLEMGEQARERVMTWAKEAPTEWCAVREARSEVTVRRDRDSPMSWFKGRAVAIWGCGAIGSLVAEWVTRAGAARVILRDNAGVTPGVLVRQNYVDADLGYCKAERLAQRLKDIAPHVQVEGHYGDVLDGPLDAGPWHEHADLVIDATASVTVGTALERARIEDRTCSIASLLFGHTAEHGLAVVCPADTGGGPVDALRAAKLACLSEHGLRRFADEFWPEPPRSELFQPEPGCSDPTFSGAATETAAVAAMLMRDIARDLQNGEREITVHVTALDGADAQGALQRRVRARPSWDIDLPQGLQLRVSERALHAMRQEVISSAQVCGADSETGGLLFGERDDAAGVLWVDEATAPPSDSEHSPELFLCGTRGVARMVADRRRRGRGSLDLVGTWHTHPVSSARPSARDLFGMAEILEATASPLAQALLVIVGHSAGTRPSIGAYMFERAELGTDNVRISGGQRRLARSVWQPLATAKVGTRRARPSRRASRSS
jgi:proteasome lid subunit RPN8/RPN11